MKGKSHERAGQGLREEAAMAERIESNLDPITQKFLARTFADSGGQTITAPFCPGCH